MKTKIFSKCALFCAIFMAVALTAITFTSCSGDNDEEKTQEDEYSVVGFWQSYTFSKDDNPTEYQWTMSLLADGTGQWTITSIMKNGDVKDRTTNLTYTYENGTITIMGFGKNVFDVKFGSQGRVMCLSNYSGTFEMHKN